MQNIRSCQSIQTITAYVYIFISLLYASISTKFDRDWYMKAFNMYVCKVENRCSSVINEIHHIDMYSTFLHTEECRLYCLIVVGSVLFDSVLFGSG